MSKKTATIAPIVDEPGSEQNIKNSLLRAKSGPRTRIPGTAKWMTPDRELTGKYRTGLDPDAAYINRIDIDKDRVAEKERVKALRKELEMQLGLTSNGEPDKGLGPYSEFWDHSKRTGDADNKHVTVIKLQDQDNVFNLEDPWQMMTFSWLSVSRRIASSLHAFKMGQFPGAQFYVVNKKVENELSFKKKKEINKAIVVLDDLTPTRMLKIARAMGLPVTDDTKQEEAYKLIDDALKQTEFRSGDHKGANPIRVFMDYTNMPEDDLEVKDLAKQLISYNVLRRKDDGLYRGEAKVADNIDKLIKMLKDEDQQEFRLVMDQQLKNKKLIAV